MLTEYGVLKPDVPRPAKPGQEIHERWQQERQEKNPDWTPLSPKYNIRYTHDPLWRDRLFSIQNVRDAQENFNWRKPTHWFWGAVGLAMIIGDLMWYYRVANR